ncbi:MAG: hypothetical protein EBR86_09905 [Planctomycetia bacterium]|nr:hypothetical protein [Planctomycetia bacterium]
MGDPAGDDPGDDEEGFLGERLIGRCERLATADHRCRMEHPRVVGRAANHATQHRRGRIPVDDEVLIPVGRIAAQRQGRAGGSRIGGPRPLRPGHGGPDDGGPDDGGPDDGGPDDGGARPGADAEQTGDGARE